MRKIKTCALASRRNMTAKSRTATIGGEANLTGRPHRAHLRRSLTRAGMDDEEDLREAQAAKARQALGRDSRRAVVRLLVLKPLVERVDMAGLVALHGDFDRSAPFALAGGMR
ncbi:hypothetical protein [Mesorhizobium sp.]|uniref:hypothetical protein n=1 Tax=Mesorhizobium sp. TaxID=1871066 RepID=UPI0025D6359E|nr:hypothetical protein [Mesorhizobium sp.]